MQNFITLESIILDSSKDKIIRFLVGPSSIKDQSSRHKKTRQSTSGANQFTGFSMTDTSSLMRWHQKL